MRRLERFLGDASPRVAVGLFATALGLYLLGMSWGLPQATTPDRLYAWGSDELAPVGTLAETYRAVTFSSEGNPQYPIFHYLVQAGFVAPYLGGLAVTGGLEGPGPSYPFGLRDPVDSLATVTLLARLASALLAAVLVVAAYRTGTELWDRRAGLIGAVVVMLMYPMFYYSRTSNVDMAALAWTGLGLAVFAVALRRGLTSSRAVWLGIFAALATATKDASWAAFAGMGLVLVPMQLAGRLSGDGAPGARWRPLLVGLGTAAVVYALASGLALSPARFGRHVEYLLGSTAAFVYPGTVAGYAGLIGESLSHTFSALGSPALLFGLAGIVVAARRRSVGLWLLLPAALVLPLTILPVHFVNFRYILIIAYVLSLFAGAALAGLFEAPPGLSRLAPVVVAVVCGWSLLRGLDLTGQMWGDSRYEVGGWIADNAAPGDRVGYFGAPQKLPPLPAAIASVSAQGLCTRQAWASAAAPELVIVIPQQHFEVDREWTLRPEVYRALEDGSLGYRLVMRHQTRALFAERPVPFVNPPVRLYARRGHPAAERADDPVDDTRPRLAGLERLLGHGRRVPGGLVRNPTIRTFEGFCTDGEFS